MRIHQTIRVATVVLVSAVSTIPALADSSPAVHLMARIWLLAGNATDAETDTVLARADALSGTISSCEDFRLAHSPGLFRDYGWVSLDDIPPEIRAIAVNQSIGIPSQGIRQDFTVDVFVVCGRVTLYPAPPIHRW